MRINDRDFDLKKLNNANENLHIEKPSVVYTNFVLQKR